MIQHPNLAVIGGGGSILHTYSNLHICKSLVSKGWWSICRMWMIFLYTRYREQRIKALYLYRGNRNLQKSSISSTPASICLGHLELSVFQPSTNAASIRCNAPHSSAARERR
jgi:hypothetical protein